MPDRQLISLASQHWTDLRPAACGLRPVSCGLCPVLEHSTAEDEAATDRSIKWLLLRNIKWLL
jgi:hypothetical protein